MESNLIQLAIAVLGGGSIQFISTYLLNRKNSERDDFDTLIDTYSQDNSRLREETSKRDEEIKQLSHELNRCNSRHRISKEVQEQSPIPSWVKSDKGIMVWMNKAYEEHLLIPNGKSRSEYRLERDGKIWPDKTKEAFHKTDLHVIETGETIFFEQEIIVNGKSKTWMVVKYRFDNKEGIKGVGGCCIPRAKLKNKN